MTKFQAPKGTRDYYPDEMALRRYLERKWREVSIRNGFEEVDGPIFEPLDLYKVKSGEGIVNELFHFADRGDRELAIRPEFTPTLARMVAAKAHALPKPIKWFSMPNLCRAERPQRGRLREFLQWNIDMLGVASPVADAECIFTAVDLMRSLGLQPHQARVKISHRDVVGRILLRLGVPESKMTTAFDLLDRRSKMDPDEFAKEAEQLGLDQNALERFNEVTRVRYSASDAWDQLKSQFSVPEQDLADLEEVHSQLKAFGVEEWCEYDLGIVRGLAYYTGTVFEIHEVSGAERAMAGGGRYDKLIELFGGSPTPGVGFLSLVLADKGLLPTETRARPDAFVMAADEALQPEVASVAAWLREAGVHTRFSYRTTTNVGKLLGDADQSGARFAVILDPEVKERSAVAVKDLASGEQQVVRMEQLVDHLHERTGAAASPSEVSV